MFLFSFIFFLSCENIENQENLESSRHSPAKKAMTVPEFPQWTEFDFDEKYLSEPYSATTTDEEAVILYHGVGTGNKYYFNLTISWVNPFLSTSSYVLETNYLEEVYTQWLFKTQTVKAHMPKQITPIIVVSVINAIIIVLAVVGVLIDFCITDDFLEITPVPHNQVQSTEGPYNPENPEGDAPPPDGSYNIPTPPPPPPPPQPSTTTNAPSSSTQPTVNTNQAGYVPPPPPPTVPTSSTPQSDPYADKQETENNPYLNQNDPYAQKQQPEMPTTPTYNDSEQNNNANNEEINPADDW